MHLSPSVTSKYVNYCYKNKLHCSIFGVHKLCVKQKFPLDCCTSSHFVLTVDDV